MTDALFSTADTAPTLRGWRHCTVKLAIKLSDVNQDHVLEFVDLGLSMTVGSKIETEQWCVSGARIVVCVASGRGTSTARLAPPPRHFRIDFELKPSYVMGSELIGSAAHVANGQLQFA